MKILSSIAILSSLEAVTAGKHKHQKAKALKEHSISVPETLRGGKEKKAKVHKELSLSLPEGFKGDKHKKKAKVHKPLSLSLPDAATGGKLKKAKGHKDFSLSLPVNVRGHKHREKKFENALITRKSLKPHGFGPKHKAELCDTLTSSVLLFDVDSSEGLDWDEFQVFNTAIVDVVMDHAVDGTRQLQNEDTDEDLGIVYHDMTCQCHYTFGHPIKCCREEKQEEDTSPVQVSFQGLDINGEGKSEEDEKYRKNFCDGVMYLLQSEGVDLETANDAIMHGLNMDVVDWDIIDTEEVTDETADQTEEAVDEESLDSSVTEEDSVESIVEWIETAEESQDESEESFEKENESTDSEITEEVIVIEESASSSNSEKSTTIDASASSIVSASTTDQVNDDSDSKSSLAAGATIGIAFAFILAMLAIVLAVIRRRKVEEKQRLTAFAGEELIDDDVEANSVHNDIVAIEKLRDQEIEVTPTEAVSEENDDNSDAMSVVSLDHQQECAQISFVDDTEGAVEANLSTLAAMGVASTVTSRLSAQQPAVSPSKSLKTGTF